MLTQTLTAETTATNMSFLSLKSTVVTRREGPLGQGRERERGRDKGSNRGFRRVSVEKRRKRRTFFAYWTFSSFQPSVLCITVYGPCCAQLVLIVLSE